MRNIIYRALQSLAVMVCLAAIPLVVGILAGGVYRLFMFGLNLII